MQIVTQPTLTPSCCLVTKKAGVECFDLLRDFDFDHTGRMYISLTSVRDMARMIGMVDPTEVDQDRVAELEAERDQLAKELEDLRAFRQAVDVIESQEFRARKKAGRPKKEAIQVG